MKRLCRLAALSLSVLVIVAAAAYLPPGADGLGRQEEAARGKFRRVRLGMDAAEVAVVLGTGSPLPDDGKGWCANAGWRAELFRFGADRIAVYFGADGRVNATELIDGG